MRGSALADAIRGWLRVRSEAKRCFHHDHRKGFSFIYEEIIDYRKRYQCRRCGRVWVW